MATRVAINGFGRIGRCIARLLLGQNTEDLELVAVNDLIAPDTLAHLLCFDSVHGRFPDSLTLDGNHLKVGAKRVAITSERNPEALPWKDLNVDVVLECTGVFRDLEGASKHLAAGAKRVIVSAPGKRVDATFCVGINSDRYDRASHRVVSNASCTTNCLAPVAKVLHERFTILGGQMVTVHAYTADQRLQDAPHNDLRRARAAALSIIPTTTGAAKAIGLVLPELEGKLDGVALRVPTPDVSLVCLTAKVDKATDTESVNRALKEASDGKLKGVLAFEERPLVSSDFIGHTASSIVDSALTQVIDGNLVHVESWYDNETGFSARMIDLARLLSS